jgi:hypothetical protein
MEKIDEVKKELSQADEILLNLRSDMEENIRSYMIETKTDPLKVDVFFGGRKHDMVITIEPLSEDGDGDADLLFEDKHTGVDGMKIYDAELSTDLLAGICMELSETY